VDKNEFLAALDELIFKTRQDLMHEQERPRETFARLAGQKAYELAKRLEVLEEVRKLYLDVKHISCD